MVRSLRALVVGIALAWLAAIAVGQAGRPTPLRKLVTTGTFVDRDGVAHRWYINEAHTVIWDGRPYLPVGGMYVYRGRDQWETVKAQLDLMKRMGVIDLYLHLGVNVPGSDHDSPENIAYFQRTIDHLDQLGMRYGTQLQGYYPDGWGYPYEGGPTVEKITSSGIYSAEPGEVRSCLYLLVDQTDGTVRSGKAEVIENKRVQVKVDCPTGHTLTLCLTPETKGWRPYLWDGRCREWSDQMLRHYRAVKLGKGFRFVVDPYWNEVSFHYDFVPQAEDFRTHLAKWLRARYRTIAQLNRAWQALDRVPSFEVAARLVALRRMRDSQSGRDVSYQCDRDTGQCYRLAVGKSQYRYDFFEALGKGHRDFHNALANDFKTVADVPVIYKSCSDLDWAFINDSERADGFDGMGMEAYGTGEPLAIMNGIPAFAECEQATKTTWLCVTETAQGNHQDASPSRNVDLGYTDRLANMYANFNVLTACGAKGIFHFPLTGVDEDKPWSSSLLLDPRQLEWLRTYREMLENAPGIVNYRPTAYFRWPALFNPNNGLSYSDPWRDFSNAGGYWAWGAVGRAANSAWILPSFTLDVDTPMLMANLEDAPASLRFGADLERAIRSGRRITYVGFRKDLGSVPLLDRYFTDRFERDGDGKQVQVLKPPRGAKVLGRTPSGAAWNLSVGNLQIISKQVSDAQGWQPEGLVTGLERGRDPWREFLSKVCNVSLLTNLGEGLSGFTYPSDGGKTRTAVIWASGQPRTLRLPLLSDEHPQVAFPDGTPAGRMEKGSLVVELQPQDHSLRHEAVPFAPGGQYRDSEHTREAVIIRGLRRNLVVPDSRRSAPLDPRLIWIEGERATQTNFNCRAWRAMLECSSDAFLSLDSSADAPADTGYFATYRFRVKEAGTYQVWLREWYLSENSPCEWRLDQGKWQPASNLLPPQDIRMVSAWAPIDDERIHFAWYHYASLPLAKGEHSLAFRVTQRRPAGNKLWMARASEYAKHIDVVLLIAGAFTPNGKERPKATGLEPVLPSLNLLTNPSLELDADNDGFPDGWARSDQATRGEDEPIKWSVTPVGTMRESYVGICSLRITGGDVRHAWQTGPIPVKPGSHYLLGGFLRGEHVAGKASLAVSWRSAGGLELATEAVTNTGDFDWRWESREMTAPAGATTAVISCAVEGQGRCWFDDLDFHEQRR